MDTVIDLLKGLAIFVGAFSLAKATIWVYRGKGKRRRPFTLHRRNVGGRNSIITHWTSGPGNYTFDPLCPWCQILRVVRVIFRREG